MLARVQEALRCIVCRHQPIHPVALHCGHSVCRRHVPNDRLCPVPACTPVPSDRPHIPPASTVAFHPAQQPDGPPFPPLDPAAQDVAVAKIIALVLRTKQRIALRQRSADDDPDDDGDDDGRPRKRRKPNADSGSELDLVAHLRSTAAIIKSTSADEPLPPTDPVLAEFEKELCQELSCDICSSLFYQPVTTPCQHTFCFKCLQRSLDHSSNCPLCRQTLPDFVYFQNHPFNDTILRILLEAYRPVYEARGEAIEQEERAARLDTPIFVCVLCFPGMPTGLHIFEPRYRLMLRRCLELERPEFGMLPAPKNGDPNSMPEFGTMLEIKSVQMLPDGRSVVNCWGTSRFRILERGTLDGYTVARIERIDDYPDDLIESIDNLDASPPEESTLPPSSSSSDLPTSTSSLPSSSSSIAPKDRPTDDTEEEAPRGTLVADDATSSAGADPIVTRGRTSATTAPPTSITRSPVRPTNAELIETCRVFLDRLQRGTAPWVVQRLSNSVGAMPSDPALVSFYVATILPIDESEKQKLLPIRSARLRLLLTVHWIEQLNNNWWFSAGCSIFSVLRHPFFGPLSQAIVLAALVSLIRLLTFAGSNSSPG